MYFVVLFTVVTSKKKTHINWYPKIKTLKLNSYLFIYF